MTSKQSQRKSVFQLVVNFHKYTPYSIKQYLQLNLENINSTSGIKRHVLFSYFQLHMQIKYGQYHLIGNQYTQAQLIQQLNFVQKWGIYIFQTHQFDNPNLLRTVSKIQFPNLMKLDIRNCHIENIQPLSWIYCPNLQQIYVTSTKIVSIKPLLKSRFKKLKILLIEYRKYDTMITPSQYENYGRLLITPSKQFYLNFKSIPLQNLWAHRVKFIKMEKSVLFPHIFRQVLSHPLNSYLDVRHEKCQNAYQINKKLKGLKILNPKPRFYFKGAKAYTQQLGQKFEILQDQNQKQFLQILQRLGFQF